MLKMKVKLNFKLLSSNVLYDGFIRAEALNTCGLVALCADRARLRVNTLPRVRSLAWHGEMPTPSRRGRPTGEELGSVTPLGGKVEQGLAPKSSIPIGMERGYKAGLLVAEAKVKGFEKPWSILIDSGTSIKIY